MSDPVGTTDEGAACPLLTSDAPIARRSFLVWAAGASLGASAVFIGATALQAMMPPRRSIDGTTKAGRLAVSRLSDLQVGRPRLAQYGETSVFVVKTSNSKVAVFDAACPHLGCALRFNETSGHFDCPCHGSSFNLGGVRLVGPAVRNMTAAVSDIVDGQVVVSGFRA